MVCDATIASVLVQRGARCSRLSRLEFFWFEDGCMDEDACLGEGLRRDQVDLSGELVEEALGNPPTSRQHLKSQPHQAMEDGPGSHWSA